MYYKSYYKSPLGQLSIICDDDSLCGLYFQNQKYFEKGFENKELIVNESPLHKKVTSALDDYFLGDDKALINLPLKTNGTPFQEKVWNALKDISFSQTITYGELAKKINCKSAQAVGGAIGRNPIAIVIPCHRVLGKNGTLTGYVAGEDCKKWLLNHEKEEK